MKKTTALSLMLLLALTMGLPGEAAAITVIDPKLGDCNHLTVTVGSVYGPDWAFDINSVKQNWGTVKNKSEKRIFIGPGCAFGTTCGPDIEVSIYDRKNPLNKARYQFMQGWCFVSAGQAVAKRLSGPELNCSVEHPRKEHTAGTRDDERGGSIWCR